MFGYGGIQVQKKTIFVFLFLFQHIVFFQLNLVDRALQSAFCAPILTTISTTSTSSTIETSSTSTSTASSTIELSSSLAPRIDVTLHGNIHSTNVNSNLYEFRFFF